MTNRRFFICIALALGVIVVFNIFLALKVDSFPKLIMRKMRAAPRIDILFFGNSLMQAGFDPVAFASAWPSSTTAPSTFNAGMGWSSPVEHYVLAHQTLLQHPEVHYLVYGFYDFQLIAQEGFGWNDLEGNRAMAYSMEPDTSAALYAPGSAWEKWRFRAIGAIPALRDHSQLWKLVEFFRRDLQQIGMPENKTNEFGRVADFQSFGSPDLATFEQTGETAVTRSTPFVPAIEQLLETAREKKIRVVIVEMPMTPYHRNRYYATPTWQKYRAYVKEKIEAAGATYIEADDWAPDDADFNDALHLNAAGAGLFSRKMADALDSGMKLR
jgi:hypothetical protein